MAEKLLLVKNRIILISLFFFLCHFCFSQVDSLNQKISYQQQDQNLIDFFKFLETNHHFRFSFCSDELKNTSLSLDFQQLSLNQALDEISSLTGLEFKIVENNILIRKSNLIQESTSTVTNNMVLKGKVFTESAQDVLSFATISISNSTVGTYTDDDGYFIIEFPIDLMEEQLLVSYMGYKVFSFDLKDTNEELILIPLTEDTNVIEVIEIMNREKPIKIEAKKNMLTLSSFQINAPTSGLSGSNVIRNLQILPGIVAHNDNSIQLEIRGSNGDATLTLINQIPLYKSNHYFGLFSPINSIYLDSVNVYRSIFPMRYSGKTGGIAEMFTKRGFPQSLNLELDLNALYFQSGVSILLYKKAYMYFTVKSSVSSIGNAHFLSSRNDRKKKDNVQTFKDQVKNTSSTPEVRFLDIQSTFGYQHNKKFTTHLHSSFASEQYENSTELYLNNQNNDSIKVNIVEMGEWTNFGASLIHNYRYNSNSTYEIITHYSVLDEENENDTRIKKKRNNNNDLDELDLNGEQENRLEDFGHSQQLNYSKGHSKYSVGFDYHNYQLQYSFKENRDLVIQSSDQINRYGAYVKYNLIKENLSTHAGLRANYFPELNQFLLSPRILFNLKLNGRWSTKASFAQYNQVVRQLFFEYRTIPMQLWTSSLSNDIPLLKSNNIMLGTTFKNDRFTIDFEAYYKKLDGLSEFVVLDPEKNSNFDNESREYILFNGDGRIIGLDVMFATGYKKYETFLCYTLSKAVERYPEINDYIYYASENDRRHQVKWMNSYLYRNFTFGLNAFYSSGRTYTKLSTDTNTENISLRSFENRFNRLPYYQRIDASLTYNMRIKGKNVAWSGSVFNLFNRQNVKYIQSFVTSIEEQNELVNTVVGNEVTLLSRTFNIGLRMSF